MTSSSAGADPDAFAALQSLAETLAIPVVGAPGSSCANFPYDDPLWLGVGAYQHLENADLVLLIGGRTPWYPPSKRRTSGRIISLNEHPIKGWLTYQNLQADEYVEGDLAPTLGVLTEAIRRLGIDDVAVNARLAKSRGLHDLLCTEIQNERTAALARSNLNVAAICEIMTHSMPLDTIYVEETITHSALLKRHLPLNSSQSYFRNSGGGLGQGLGISLGIKLAARDRPVAFFVGDGSMLYNPIIQALGASKEYDLPILVVVLNNGGYASMKGGQQLFYPDGAASKRGFEHGVTINAPAFEDLGSHFGFFGESVRVQLKDARAKGCSPTWPTGRPRTIPTATSRG